LYVEVSYFRAIALSPFISVIANTLLGDIDGLVQYLKLRTFFYTTLRSHHTSDLSSALLEYRPELIAKYAFSIPVIGILEIIADYSPLVEVGAGTGYWAMCLTEVGAEIDAFDLQPPI